MSYYCIQYVWAACGNNSSCTLIYGVVLFLWCICLFIVLFPGHTCPYIMLRVPAASMTYRYTTRIFYIELDKSKIFVF